MIELRLTRNAGWRRSRRELAELKAFATRHDLAFTAVPTVEFECFDFFLFRFATHPEWANMLHGTWRGLPVAAADYRALRIVPAPAVGADERWSVVVLEHDLALPHLIVQSKNWADRLLLDPLDTVFKPVDRFFERIETPRPKLATAYPVAFQSPAFNRQRYVSCPDQACATRLIDDAMMRWLTGPGARYDFETHGRHVLAYHKRMRPDRLAALLDAATGFHDHIPAAVHSAYAAAADGRR